MRIVRAWWDVMKSLGNLLVMTVRMFLRDPNRMLLAVGHHYLGDKRKAAELFRQVEAKKSDGTQD